MLRLYDVILSPFSLGTNSEGQSPFLFFVATPISPAATLNPYIRLFGFVEAAGLIGDASQYKGGLMPSSYARYNTSGQGLNLNDCKDLWRHYSTLNGTNAPANGYIGFFNVGYDPDWFIQIAFVVQTGGSYKMFRRAFHSGTTWTAWTSIP